MTAEQIDKDLQTWQSSMEAAARALADLSALPSSQILDTLQLTGETNHTIGPAVLALKQLWRDFNLLAKTVNQAADLRAKISTFSFSHQNWNQIEALLTERCIPAGDPAGITANKITLAQLHARINTTFAQAQAGLLAIDASWKAIQKKLAEALPFLDAHPEETVELRQDVEALRPRVLPDPIGANRDFDAHIATPLQQAQSEIAKRAAQRGNLSANLTAARQIIQKLDEIRLQNDAACRECQEKISGRFTEPALAAQRITECNQLINHWEKQASTSGGSSLDRTCEELARATSEWQRLMTHEQSALAQNRTPLELRRELRGRLTALKAKATARGRGEDPELVRLAGHANALLYARPTPIDEALTAVTNYQALLNKQEMKQA